MWAITSYYNPVGHARRLANYKRFRANLGIPLVTVELSFNGVFELEKDDADILIQISGAALLWQKERLLNLALKAVPADVEHVAWLDCDVVLKRIDWAAGAEERLKDLNVVQLFSDAIFVQPEDLIRRAEDEYSCVPCLLSLSDAKDRILVGATKNAKNSPTYATGFAWAAKREILEYHGFYDAAIAGSGDTLMAAAMFGEYDSIGKRFMFNEARQQHYLRWAVAFHKSVAGRIGYISGTILHLKHGEMENRGYLYRLQRLADFNFDPDTDLTIGWNGAWHWARPRPDLESFFRTYFVSRAEDS